MNGDIKCDVKRISHFLKCFALVKYKIVDISFENGE